MNDEKRYYVYVHRYKSGEKEGEVFYVGKGTGTRVHSNTSRNPHWHNINNKYGRTCEILFKGMTSSEACEKERDVILSMGRDTLCNLSDGGESGSAGLKHTEEFKRKMSESMVRISRERMAEEGWTHPCLGRKLSDESRKRLSDSLKAAWDKSTDEYRASRGEKIRKALSTKETVELRSRMNQGSKNPAYDHAVRKFIHKDGSIFIGTQYELYKKYNLSQGNVNQMVNGIRATVSGWRISL